MQSTSLQVITYVVTRPGRELLFTVVSQDEKYKAKVSKIQLKEKKKKKNI